MASSSDTGALQRLETAVTSTQALCQQLATSLDAIYKDPSTPLPADTTDSKIIPLGLARDAATLVRAHATKLSLLLINEPFSASAIADVLKQLLSGPVLGVASAAQACDPARYTAFFRKELAWRSRRVLLTLGELLGKIPKDGKPLSGVKKSGVGADDKGSLPSTGILWSACDEVVALVGGGVGGYFVKRVEEWRDTLIDVMEELKDWGDEEPDDDDDNDDDSAHEADADNAQNGSTSAQDFLDDLMGSGQTIPRDDPKAIRPRLESTLRRVRLVVLLYQAITKRRLKKLPPLPPPAADSTSMPQRLDEAARVLGALPDAFGDLAAAFYDMEPAAIDRAADDCFFNAFAAGELLSAPWDGSADEFSEWTEKFKTEIKKS
ncbi:hypothetical protein LMH87_009385 [Akanthomyces muscarius]|uniref:Cyclin-D1-binding protein 1-like N-terminal domain-containing protein n=1 Tax=Akanthomyces muscarius TaxID=2231603 RepID=A0A9W8QC12_AKAMU|nr:hypothetical protein LMH87_009385 [Akanthomyces muscarius]KAJ4152865.1 hypothetical protein LMH87_009385 [Akanthomyces muscarius]